MEPFRYRDGRVVRWYSKSLQESNFWCLYCAAYLGPGSTVASNKEHLIARNFVPKGSLDGPGFNLIFRACRGCNSQKADAERHVSSVSLFNSPARLDDSRINDEAKRKASKDFHPHHPGAVVAASSTEHTYTAAFGGAAFTFNLVAPPQADHQAIALLATRHIQGLFALVTIPDPRSKEIRLLHPEQCRVLAHYHVGDWGNPQLTAITQRVAHWESRATIVAANGFFKAKLRRSSVDSEGWFWALEWNRSLRIVGMITFPHSQPVLLSDLPALDWLPMPDGQGRMRRDAPIDPDRDTLFSFD